MIGTLLLAAAPMAAQAEDMNDSFTGLGHAETNIDTGPSGDGSGPRGSVGLAENFLVFADDLNEDIAGGEFDLYSVGLGGRLGF
jgi:hypothetical protein